MKTFLTYCFFLILASIFVFGNKTEETPNGSNQSFPPGSYRPISVDNKNLLKVLQIAESRFLSRKNNTDFFKRGPVLSAEHQLVSGNNYRVKLEIHETKCTSGGCLRLCHPVNKFNCSLDLHADFEGKTITLGKLDCILLAKSEKDINLLKGSVTQSTHKC